MMTGTPRISVVITCYNYGQYLDGCLRSVLDQTCRDWEAVVVDDGSTDDTPQVMARFADVPNLRYVRRENGGQAVAKNTGIRESRGEFVAFLDADDLWEPTKLAKQIELFADPRVGVVYSRAKWIDEDGAALDNEFGGKYLQPRAGRVTDWLFQDNFVWFSSSMVRRSCLEACGSFDESLAMGIDWDLWLRISTRYEFAYVNEPLLGYRVGHSGQMSRNTETRQRCSDRIMARFLENYPGAVSKGMVRNAYYLTYCNRGEYYRANDKDASYRYFLRALAMRPWGRMAYAGIARTLLSRAA
jgi:glycosyltransferase involved in cell wall biosynthesis